MDASWYLPQVRRNASGEFLAAHIPGAGYFDIDAASDPATSLPHMLPSAEHFASYVGSLGIGNDTTVVIYDGSGNNLSAPRVWWMFRVFGHDRVAVLDGGIARWKEEGRPLASGEPSPKLATFHARLDTRGVRGINQVRDALRTGSSQVVDLRSRGRFEGREPEPRAGLPSGHMPGARNLPYQSLSDNRGRFQSLEVLRQLIQDAGIRLGQPVIASCGSGVSACSLLLVLNLLGHDGALYDGSWTEWTSTGGQVATGSAG